MFLFYSVFTIKYLFLFINLQKLIKWLYTILIDICDSCRFPETFWNTVKNFILISYMMQLIILISIIIIYL